MIKLCFTVNRNSSDSRPIKPPAPAATAMDCGDIILPTTPPETLAPTATTGSTPIDDAVTDCSFPKSAFADVSDPVINTPSHPSTGAKNGKSGPVDAST